jgi:hypothetical protein
MKNLLPTGDKFMMVICDLITMSHPGSRRAAFDHDLPADCLLQSGTHMICPVTILYDEMQMEGSESVEQSNLHDPQCSDEAGPEIGNACAQLDIHCNHKSSKEASGSLAWMLHATNWQPCNGDLSQANVVSTPQQGQPKFSSGHGAKAFERDSSEPLTGDGGAPKAQCHSPWGHSPVSASGKMLNDSGLAAESSVQASNKAVEDLMQLLITGRA